MSGRGSLGSEVKTVVLGSDHAGYELKADLVAYLRETRPFDVVDVGASDGTTSVDYPDYAAEVARAVAGPSGMYLPSRGLRPGVLGIVVCGTGIGVSLAANRVPGARCALVHDEFTARAAAEHNHANILALGGRLLASHAGRRLVDAWLDAVPEARHTRRLTKVHALDSI